MRLHVRFHGRTRLSKIALWLERNPSSANCDCDLFVQEVLKNAEKIDAQFLKISKRVAS
jgi:hypothetical protein